MHVYVHSQLPEFLFVTLAIVCVEQHWLDFASCILCPQRKDQKGYQNSMESSWLPLTGNCFGCWSELLLPGCVENWGFGQTSG
jgi:hypothetical protein